MRKIIGLLGVMSSMLVSMPVWSMQQLDDTALAAATGQDGIDIKIVPTGPLNFDVVIHDKDGLTGVPNQTYDSAGAIVFGRAGIGPNALSISSGSSNIEILVRIDADAGIGGNQPTLNINVSLPQKLTLQTGDIWVAKSNSTSPTDFVRGYTLPVKVMNNMRVEIEDWNLNLQLGNEPQGAMIKLGGLVNVHQGIRIDNFVLSDNSGIHSGGGIGIGRINIMDSTPDGFGDRPFNFAVSVDANAQGLVVSLDQFGNGGSNIWLRRVRLGDTALLAPALGDVELRGVQMAGTAITITGH
ncbi:MAG: hypothetical protein VXW65_03365 [Pseudomonadota bacterium]|nr:hypothetical protein [Pseudomonadota bacterium]